MVVQPSPVRINFGKYKEHNYTFKELFEKDINYCRWLIKQPFIKANNDLRFELEELLKNINEDEASCMQMTWGKYKNKSLEWIQKTDPSYIEWLKKNQFVKENCKRLFEELNKLARP